MLCSQLLEIEMIAHMMQLEGENKCEKAFYMVTNK